MCVCVCNVYLNVLFVSGYIYFNILVIGNYYNSFRLFLTNGFTIFNNLSSYYIFSKYISQNKGLEKLGRKKDANP